MRALLLVAAVGCGHGGSSSDGHGGAMDASADQADAASDTAPAIWSPAPGTSWQWQLSGAIDTSVDAAMFDVDLFEAPAPTLDQLVAAGRAVICYFSAGSRENWRPDAADFPDEAIGRPLDGWPDERWLDVRHPAVRAVIEARLDLAVARGCVGVEPDNVDGYANDAGFPLTAGDQLAFNRFLAAAAHARGLSAGLKNDVEQVADLVDDFDWALDEECVRYDECAGLVPFIDAGKAVFHVEYGTEEIADRMCAATAPLGFSTLVKRLSLNAWRIACPVE
jgi:hypothetical protein